MQSFNHVLNSTTVKHLLQTRAGGSDKPVISLPITSTLTDALTVMEENMIISIPLVDGDRCVAIIDNVDILNFLVKSIADIKDWLINSSAEVNTVLAGVKVTEVIDFSQGDPLLVTGEDANVESLMKFFTSGLSHRCVVNTKSGFSICSQFDVVRLLNSSMKVHKQLERAAESHQVMNHLQSRSVTDETVTIGSTEYVYAVLDRMVEKKVHAVAVVDEMKDGQIIGNFSATDLLHLKDCRFKELSLSVREYLDKHSPTSLNPVTIEAGGTTVSDVLGLFAETGLHRLWVVDSGSNTSFPVGVVTLSDILKIVSNL